MHPGKYGKTSRYLGESTCQGTLRGDLLYPEFQLQRAMSSEVRKDGKLESRRPSQGELPLLYKANKPRGMSSVEFSFYPTSSAHRNKSSSVTWASSTFSSMSMWEVKSAEPPTGSSGSALDFKT